MSAKARGLAGQLVTVEADSSGKLDCGRAVFQSGSLLDLLGRGFPEGWHGVSQSGPGRAAWRLEPIGYAAYLSVDLGCPPEVVLDILQDPGESGLAGQLMYWSSSQVAPQTWALRYTTVLPWPMRNRSFRATIRKHVDRSGDHWFFSRHDPTPWPSAPGLLCTLQFADYRLRPIHGGCTLERIIGLDLRFPLPDSMTGWLLGREQQADAHRLQRIVGGPPSQ